MTYFDKNLRAELRAAPAPRCRAAFVGWLIVAVVAAAVWL